MTRASFSQECQTALLLFLWTWLSLKTYPHRWDLALHVIPFLWLLEDYKNCHHFSTRAEMLQLLLMCPILRWNVIKQQLKCRKDLLSLYHSCNHDSPSKKLMSRKIAHTVTHTEACTHPPTHTHTHTHTHSNGERKEGESKIQRQQVGE